MPKLDFLCATIWKIYGGGGGGFPNELPGKFVTVNSLVVRGSTFSLGEGEGGVVVL